MAAQLKKEKIEYNDCAAALKFEIVNNSDDIGNWELAYQKQKQKGNGIVEFLIALQQFPQDQITVIFVKNLNAFEYLSENYVDYDGHKFFAAIRNNQLTQINFYSLQLDDNIELRNWDQFFEKEEDTLEFINKTEIIRNFFKKNRKEYLGLAKNLRSTLAKDMQEDIKYKHYLYANWNYRNVQDLAPQSQEELDLYMAANKGGYYMINPKFVNQEISNVYSFDSSSSHISLMARKKFPYGGFIRAHEGKQIIRIIKEERSCWIGRFHFEGLKQKIKIPIDLLKYGHCSKGIYTLTLTDVDWDWFKDIYEWKEVIFGDFFYSKKKELEKNYVRMIQELYEGKEAQKKGTFAKELFKFRAELPFGQSIKTPTYLREVRYSSVTNSFGAAWKDEEFETINKRLKRRDYPYQYGLWTVAYSRAELIKLIIQIGIDKVIYADTDSVKFIGEEGLEIIKKYNKEITREFDIINGKRYMDLGNKIGRWQDEGLMKKFKAIGIKWYIYIDQEDKLMVKASGVNKEKLEKYLRSQKDPFDQFDKEFYIEGLFNTTVYTKEGEVRKIINKVESTIPDKLQKEMDRYNNNIILEG